ncbi:MAG: OmpA family protein [Chitinophagaceae bacterium]
MASKKYLFLAGLFSLLTCSAFAQNSGTSASGSTYHGANYDVMDTAYTPASKMAQEQAFINHQYDFPAQPKNMWVLGINGGLFLNNGHIPHLPGWSAGVSLKKALGYVFAIRGGLNYGVAKGLDYRASSSSDYYLPPSVQAMYNGAPYVANYRTTAWEASLDAIISLNNIMFNQARNKVNYYAVIGYTGLAYNTMIDALDANGNPYNYSGINFGQTRHNVRKDLKALMDGKYESPTVLQGRTATLGKYQLRHSLDAGFGVDFKLSSRVSLQFEQKFTIPFDVYVDGANVNHEGSLNAISDVLSYSSAGLNFALGNAAKRVEPLWWMNPLDYAYNELSAPRHMKLPTPVLPDADGDGVTDQFDRCPNTPAGVAVDVHGCPLDTDGDGVPDYKDKQLITPTYCQPVDADGVGKCPDPECCKNLKAAATCNLGSLPSITFKGRSVRIYDAQADLLATVANEMRQNPDCKVVVTGHAEASKSSEQLSWDRVNAVIEYLAEKQGISRDRFIFQYSGVPGDTKTVDLRAATDADNGPNMVPPPHPDLRRK